jgi:hypothetical protein
MCAVVDVQPVPGFEEAGAEVMYRHGRGLRYGPYVYTCGSYINVVAV